MRHRAAKYLEEAHQGGEEESEEGGEEKCVYEEDILMDEMERLIRQHQKEALALDSDAPLFLFYSMHLVHMPLQVKDEILKKFDFIDDRWRKLMHAMVSEMDSNVGRIVEVSGKNDN